MHFTKKINIATNQTFQFSRKITYCASENMISEKTMPRFLSIGDFHYI